MRRRALLFMLLTFVMAASSISLAEEKGSMMGMGKEKKSSMKGKGYTHCMMMKKMMHKEMVAAGDGGVIVLFGNKLMKYDKDLNLVKQGEIKIDMEAMMEKCREMMKECGMEEGPVEESRGSEK